MQYIFEAWGSLEDRQSNNKFILYTPTNILQLFWLVNILRPKQACWPTNSNFNWLGQSEIIFCPDAPTNYQQKTKNNIGIRLFFISNFLVYSFQNIPPTLSRAMWIRMHPLLLEEHILLPWWERSHSMVQTIKSAHVRPVIFFILHVPNEIFSYKQPVTKSYVECIWSSDKMQWVLLDFLVFSNPINSIS